MISGILDALGEFFHSIGDLFEKDRVPAQTPTPVPPVPSTTAEKLLIAEANKWVGVHEQGGDNRGPEVKAFLADVGITRPAAWCAAFALYCIDQVDKQRMFLSTRQQPTKIYKSASVMEIWDKTPVSQRLKLPEPGCLMIWQSYHNDLPTHEGHMGIVTAVPTNSTVATIEGNTSDSSTVDRLDEGVYKKLRSFPALYPAMRVKGFLKVW
jgi:hypothetical protein